MLMITGISRLEELVETGVLLGHVDDDHPEGNAWLFVLEAMTKLGL